MTSKKLIKEFEFNKLMEKVGLFEAVLITYPDGKVPASLLGSYSFSLIPCVQMYNVALSNNALKNTFLRRAIKLLKQESFNQCLEACRYAYYDTELNIEAFKRTLTLVKSAGNCFELFYISPPTDELREKILRKALKLSKSSRSCLEIYEEALLDSKLEKKSLRKALKLAKSHEARQKVFNKSISLTRDKKEAMKVFKKR